MNRRNFFSWLSKGSLTLYLGTINSRLFFNLSENKIQKKARRKNIKIKISEHPLSVKR